MPGIPDMAFINREVPIAEVAGELDLRFGPNGHIHCWFPESHKNGDRTASVGIDERFNKVKCFGCGFRPMGPIDLVMGVQGMTAVEAALWIAERFPVPELPKGKHLTRQDRPVQRYGFQQPIEFLVRSGIWARLLPSTQRLLPVLLAFADKRREQDVYDLQMSWAAMRRYCGMASDGSVSRALKEIRDIGLIERSDAVTARNHGPSQPASRFVLTPASDAIVELGQAVAEDLRREILIEKELRRLKRQGRVLAFTPAPRARFTQYTSLYDSRSTVEIPAVARVACNWAMTQGPPFLRPIVAF
jgi:hypothetical protein